MGKYSCGNRQGEGGTDGARLLSPNTDWTPRAWGLCTLSKPPQLSIKAAFHDTDILARILARMSVSGVVECGLDTTHSVQLVTRHHSVTLAGSRYFPQSTRHHGEGGDSKLIVQWSKFAVMVFSVKDDGLRFLRFRLRSQITHLLPSFLTNWTRPY